MAHMPARVAAAILANPDVTDSRVIEDAQRFAPAELRLIERGLAMLAEERIAADPDDTNGDIREELSAIYAVSLKVEGILRPV